MDLTKMFVLVPSTSAATVESIKTASLSSNKVYFMEKYNQIVAKGTVYIWLFCQTLYRKIPCWLISGSL